MLRTGLQAGLRAVSRKANNNAGALRFMSKEIKFGVDGRNGMLEGVNTLADAVQVGVGDVLHRVVLACFVSKPICRVTLVFPGNR